MTDRADLDAVKHCVQSLFPKEVAVVVRDTQGEVDALYPEERAFITRAIPKRAAEFAAGRQAIRSAMAQLGMPPCAILRDEHRAPIWPDGLTGSLSHSNRSDGDGICVAVVARTSTTQAVGIDIEADTPLDADLLERICTPNDLKQMVGLGAEAQGRLAKQIFSAKECAYKAQFAQSKTVFGFQAFDLGFEGDAFTATFTRDMPPFQKGHNFYGISRISGPWIASGMHLGK